MRLRTKFQGSKQSYTKTITKLIKYKKSRFSIRKYYITITK
jgi:hypothetical protein